MKRLLVAILSVLFLSLAFYVGLSQSNEKGLSTGNVFRFSKDQKWAYQFETKLSGTLITDDQTSTTNDIGAAGILLLSVMECSDEGALLQFTLKNSVADTPLAGQFFINQQGRIERIATAEHVPESLQILAIEVLSVMEVDFSKYPLRAVTWTGQERNLSGSYPITHRITAEPASVLEIEKVYTSDANRKISGVSKLALNMKDHAWERVESSRSRNIISSLNSLAGNDSFSLTMIRIPSDAYSDDLKLTTLKWDTLSGSEYKRKLENSLQQQELGSMSLDDIKNILLEMSSSDDFLNTKGYLKLKAFLFLHPERSREFLKYLLEFDIKDRRFQALATALTAVGSPQAQDVLMEAITETAGSKKKQMIPHLGLVSEPTDSSEKFLKDLSRMDEDEPIRRTANLALGTVGHTLRDTSAARTKRILRDLNEKLQAASVEAESQNLLRAIGNIGSAEQVSIVLPYLKAPNRDTRLAAVSSLRFVDDLTAKRILINTMRYENDNQLKEAASHGLGLTPFEVSTVSELKYILFNESNLLILRNVIDILGPASVHYPEAKQVLEDFSRNCGRTELCSATEKYLPADQSR